MAWRIFLGGLLGGIIAFGWSSVSWMLLPYREQSIHALPLADSEMAVIASKVSKSGVYHWPGMAHGGAAFDATSQPAATTTQPVLDQAVDQAAWAAKYRRGPRVSFMVFHPDGADPDTPWKYIATLVCYMVGGWFAAWVTACAAPRLTRYFDRVACVLALGVFATLVAVVPNWLWWDHPLEYAFLETVDPLISWLLAGFVIAALVGHRSAVVVTVERTLVSRRLEGVASPNLEPATQVVVVGRPTAGTPPSHGRTGMPQ